MLWEYETGDPDWDWGWGRNSGRGQVVCGPSGEWEPLKGCQRGCKEGGCACK